MQQLSETPRNKHPLRRNVHTALLFILVLLLLHPSLTYARRHHVEQYNLPNPPSYAGYELFVEAPERRPEVGKPVIFKAVISPDINPDKVEYQFLINGAPTKEPGMHKVFTFQETGTYKISAVAKLGGNYLLNSPPVIIHVIDAWIEPEAVISPAKQTVRQGQEAIFTSLSETDPQSRQWLYWSVSTGHRGRGDQFIIKTDHMKPGEYPVELLVRDDRKRESIAHAVLLVTDQDSDLSDENLSASAPGNPGNNNNGDEPFKLHLHASHKHRLQNMQVVFWVQNAQIGADTELQLDTGDGHITDWSKRLRYGHRYETLGAYTAHITSRTPQGTQQSNTVTVYVWPLWLPVIMLVLGLLLAGIPFFRRRQQPPPPPPEPVSYQHTPDAGHQQLIVPTDEETPAVIIDSQADNGRQTLQVTGPISNPKNKSENITKASKDHTHDQ